MSKQSLKISDTLTSAERQRLLRQLKHGPTLPKAELAEYAHQVRRKVLVTREKVQK